MDRKLYKLTSKKVKELEQELEKLETKGRKDIADQLDWLRGLPNNQEDVTFSDILDDKRYLEKRITEIKEILANVEVVDEGHKNGEVVLGSNVKVGFEGYEEEYKIVSAIEADPLNKMISDESPVGKALIGAKVGDDVTVETGLVTKKFRILKVS